MKKYYSYFASKVEDDRVKVLSDLAYYTRRASTVLAFGDAGQGEVFMIDRLQD